MEALRIIKSAVRPDSVQSLERDLAKLNAKGAALAVEIEHLAAQEDELCDAAELAQISFQAKAARNRLKKLDAEIAAARERLDLARDAERAALRDQLLATAHSEAWDLLSKARAAGEAMARALAAREALAAAGFQRDYLSMAIPPAVNNNLLAAADLLDIYQTGLAGPPRRAPVRYSTAPTLSGREAQKALADHVKAHPQRRIVTDRGHLVGFEDLRQPPTVPPPLPPTTTPRPPIAEAAADGQRTYVVCRIGVEHPRDGRALRPGDVIALTEVEATKLMRGGAIDIVQPKETAE